LRAVNGVADDIAADFYEPGVRREERDQALYDIATQTDEYESLERKIHDVLDVLTQNFHNEDLNPAAVDREGLNIDTAEASDSLTLLKLELILLNRYVLHCTSDLCSGPIKGTG
jgi:hypothetical protein